MTRQVARAAVAGVRSLLSFNGQPMSPEQMKRSLGASLGRGFEGE